MYRPDLETTKNTQIQVTYLQTMDFGINTLIAMVSLWMLFLYLICLKDLDCNRPGDKHKPLDEITLAFRIRDILIQVWIIFID